MNVTFACPACGEPATAELDLQPAAICCASCGERLSVPVGALSRGEVHRCVVCPSTELFVRKDFPQRLGVAIVVVGFAASCISWGFYHVYLTFGILFATALVDVVLYALVGESLTCYRCHAEYRGLERMHDHRGFDLETHERYRQQAARLGANAGKQPVAGG